MSLYNMLFGMNPDSDMLLEMLGKTRADFGRFRDVYMEDGYIIVHTRNGGGNREDYEGVFEEMSNHPWYSHDQDDDFDCTYANIFFKVPDNINVEQFDSGINPREKWDAIFESLRTRK